MPQWTGSIDTAKVLADIKTRLDGIETLDIDAAGHNSQLRALFEQQNELLSDIRDAVAKATELLAVIATPAPRLSWWQRIRIGLGL